MSGEEIDAVEIPEPEEVIKQRDVIHRLIALVDGGEVEALSVYVGRRDGTYTNFQTASNAGRHEDAGRILELALLRLGFVNRAGEEEEAV